MALMSFSSLCLWPMAVGLPSRMALASLPAVVEGAVRGLNDPIIEQTPRIRAATRGCRGEHDIIRHLITFHVDGLQLGTEPAHEQLSLKPAGGALRQRHVQDRVAPVNDPEAYAPGNNDCRCRRDDVCLFLAPTRRHPHLHLLPVVHRSFSSIIIRKDNSYALVERLSNSLNARESRGCPSASGGERTMVAE